MTPARDISDGICAYLQGGFGNQLFILAAAWEQAERLDCPLYIDTSRYLAPDPLERAKETPRDYELAGLDGAGIILGADSPWYRNSPRRPTAIRRVGRGSRRLAVWRQPTLTYHDRVRSVRPGTTLLGYFQSPRYFESIAPRLASALRGAAISEAEQKQITGYHRTPAITAHVRRGDYLTPEAARHHGIASARYFARAIRLLRSQVAPVSTVRVFSDSPALAAEELSEIADLEFVPDTESLSSVATIRAMSDGVGFAMSNSSFSWWAAWLMSQDGDHPVVAPRPWQADGQSGHDQLLPGWLTLDAR